MAYRGVSSKRPPSRPGRNGVGLERSLVRESTGGGPLHRQHIVPRSCGEGLVFATFRRQALLPLMLLSLGSGCGSPALIQVETIIHPNGSCARTIWQPEGELLPKDALTSAWVARWRTVKAITMPPAFA